MDFHTHEVARMATTFGQSSGVGNVLSSSTDKALDALVLPRSWPVQADGSLEMPSAPVGRTPPIVLRIPDLEALEVRSLNEPAWWQSATMIKSVGMVGSVIVTVIVAAILASFKAQPERVTINDAPTWRKIPAATTPSPADVYGPAVAELYGDASVPEEKPSEPVESPPVETETVDTREYQPAPQLEYVPQTPISDSPNRQPVEVASEPSLPVRMPSPAWPSFNPPSEDSSDEMPTAPIGRGYVNPYVDSEDSVGSDQARTELRTADRRAGMIAKDRRDTREGAPTARLKGTIIKTNSDRSYGNIGSSLH